jgi:hydroxymethylpyrimidine/phosphomethylpyrimidine kinase
MLFSAEIIEAVAGVIAECGLNVLVVDPVMVSTSGVALLREDAVASLQEQLIPKACIITPNLPEAEVLAGRSIASLEDLKVAARDIGERFGVACALKGGHLPAVETASAASEEQCVVDVLYDDGRLDVFSVPRVDVGETHGTGCTFAAVITAELAKGASHRDAVRRAQMFVAAALASASRVGEHRPLGG